MKQIWNNAQLKIEGVLTPQSYRTWIKPIRFVEANEYTYTLEVPSEFHRNEIKERYISLIKDVISGLANESIDIQLKVAETTREEILSVTVSDEPASQVQAGEKTKNPSFATTLNAKYTFDSFVCGTSNEFAHAASQAVAEAPAEQVPRRMAIVNRADMLMAEVPGRDFFSVQQVLQRLLQLGSLVAQLRERLLV